MSNVKNSVKHNNMKKLLPLLSFIVMAMMACQGQGQAPEKNAAQAQTEQTAPVPTPAYTDLSVSEFKAKMSDPDVVVLDVRTPGEIAEGKIDGAMEIDFRAEGFSEKLDGLDKGKTYLVYCRSGGRSSNACKMMSEKGFGSLFNLDGGYMAWSKEN